MAQESKIIHTVEFIIHIKKVKTQVSGFQHQFRKKNERSVYISIPIQACFHNISDRTIMPENLYESSFLKVQRIGMT